MLLSRRSFHAGIRPVLGVSSVGEISEVGDFPMHGFLSPSRARICGIDPEEKPCIPKSLTSPTSPTA
jgi:hypothetical protein